MVMRTIKPAAVAAGSFSISAATKAAKKIAAKKIAAKKKAAANKKQSVLRRTFSS
jgi:hypothetical protein